MGYQAFSKSPKALTKGDDIGSGQIELRHLSSSLYAEIRKIGLHNHTGVGSRKVRQDMLEGSYGKTGFIMYSDDGAKRYRITITNAGALEATEL
jgi:hypothetical protein